MQVGVICKVLGSHHVVLVEREGREVFVAFPYALVVAFDAAWENA